MAAGPSAGGRAIELYGSPIGGENPPHEGRWRAAVARAATGHRPTASVMLAFRLEPGRAVDLDNLARPVLAGLRDAGVFTRGFPRLDALGASKTIGVEPGVTITLDAPVGVEPGARQAGRLLDVESPVLPIDGDHASKRAWRDAVAAAWPDEPVTEDVWVSVIVGSRRSLVGLMKPVIDGLEPVLGRDPRGRLEFVPNDDRVTWLAFRRDPSNESALRVRIGRAAG